MFRIWFKIENKKAEAISYYLWKELIQDSFELKTKF